MRRKDGETNTEEPNGKTLTELILSPSKPSEIIVLLHTRKKKAHKLSRAIKKHNRNGLVLWEYVLPQRKWVDKGQYDRM